MFEIPRKYFTAAFGKDGQGRFTGGSVTKAAAGFDLQAGTLNGLTAEIEVTPDGRSKISVTDWRGNPDGSFARVPVMGFETSDSLVGNGNGMVSVTQATIGGAEVDVADKKKMVALYAAMQSVFKSLDGGHRADVEEVLKASGFQAEAESLGSAAVTVTPEGGKLAVPEPLVPAVLGTTETTIKRGQGLHVARAVDKQSGETFRSTSSVEISRAGVIDVVSKQQMTGDGSGIPDETPDVEEVRDWVEEGKALMRDHFDNAPSGVNEWRLETIMAEIDDAAGPAFEQAEKDPENLIDVAATKLSKPQEQNGLTFRTVDNVNLVGENLDPTQIGRIVQGLSAAQKIVHETAEGRVPQVPDAISGVGLDDVIGDIPEAPKLADGGRFVVRIQGGNNRQNLLSDEAKIGGNGKVYIHEGLDENGQLDRQALICDMGLMYTDTEKTGYNGAFPSFAQYFEHRTNKNHKPSIPAKGILITHGHEDHIGAIVHHVVAGYKLPPVYCDKKTERFIRKSLQNLSVPKDEWPSFNPHLDVEGQRNNPGIVPRANESEPVPTFDIGRFRVEAAAMSHSLPGLAYYIEARMNDKVIGSALDPGDVKIDQTIKSATPTDIAWLQSIKPDFMMMDSTSSGKPGYTPSEQSIADNTTEVFEQHADKRVVASLIGSNASRLVTLLEAAGRTGRNVVADGAAVESLITTMNQVGINPDYQEKLSRGNVKQWLEDTYGVTIAGRTSKAGEEILNGEPGSTMILTTGTQDEEGSGMHLLARGEHGRLRLNPETDMVLISQTVIPGNEERYNGCVQKLRDMGVEVVTPAEYEEQTGKPLHASGHPHEQDVRDFVTYVQPAYAMPVHGGPQQLTKTAEIIQDQGIKVFNGSNQDYIEIRHGEEPKSLGHMPETWVYEKNIRPKGQYWGGDVEYNRVQANPLLEQDDPKYVLYGAQSAASQEAFDKRTKEIEAKASGRDEPEATDHAGFGSKTPTTTVDAPEVKAEDEKPKVTVPPAPKQRGRRYAHGL